MSYPGGFGSTPWQPTPQQTSGGYGPPPRRRTGLIIGIVAAVVLLVLGGGAALVVLWPDKEHPVETSALSGVLLSKAEAGEILGTGPLVKLPDEDDKVFEGFENSPATVVDEACHVGGPDDEKAHDGSGWTDVRVQYLQVPPTDGNTDEDGNTDTQIIQSVVAYPDSGSAADYVTSTKPKWEKCADRTVNLRLADSPDDPDDMWEVGAVTEHDGTLTWPSSSAEAGLTCVEAMAARANLVIEVEDCHKTGDKDSTDAMIAKIGEKIDQAPRAKN